MILIIIVLPALSVRTHVILDHPFKKLVFAAPGNAIGLRIYTKEQILHKSIAFKVRYTLGVIPLMPHVRIQFFDEIEVMNFLNRV